MWWVPISTLYLIYTVWKRVYVPVNMRGQRGWRILLYRCLLPWKTRPKSGARLVASGSCHPPASTLHSAAVIGKRVAMPRIFFGSWIRTQFPMLSQQAVLPIQPFLQTLLIFISRTSCMLGKWPTMSHTSRPLAKISLKEIITTKLKYKELSLLFSWFVIWGYFLVRSELSITHSLRSQCLISIWKGQDCCLHLS